MTKRQWSGIVQEPEEQRAVLCASEHLQVVLGAGRCLLGGCPNSEMVATAE